MVAIIIGIVLGAKSCNANGGVGNALDYPYKATTPVGYSGRVIGNVTRVKPVSEMRNGGLEAYPEYGKTLSSVIGNTPEKEAARNALIYESSYLTSSNTWNGGAGGYGKGRFQISPGAALVRPLNGLHNLAMESGRRVRLHMAHFKGHDFQRVKPIPAGGAGFQMVQQIGYLGGGQIAVQIPVHQLCIFLASAHFFAPPFCLLDLPGAKKFPVSTSFCRSFSRARAMRDLTVPSSSSKELAISP